MSTIAVWLSKAWLVLTLAVTGVTGAAHAGAGVLGPSDAPTPQASSYDRLQRVWARQQGIQGRLGRFFENIDQRIDRGQALIDLARANGKDVSALQSALDAFTAAVKQARPTYESTQGIIASHRGFDANGNVVEVDPARQTVVVMHDKLKEIRQTIVPAARTLRQAIQDFRAPNHETATPTP